ncbi:tubulin domain-containing protein [Trametes polyzona]|nr:tubulin domain-containing protein [Trametes polyzona]
MKEILYVHAGPFANYIGTHFWNTQEGYFTYGEDEDPVVFHDRSFREGLTSKGEPTFCPRLLIFDRKSHFGALSDELYADAADSAPAGVTQWEGGVVEYRQEPVPKSAYQTRLDEAESGEPEGDDDDAADTSNIRFWSDYSRVYYHPRSAQKLPDISEWQRTQGEWAVSKETFANYEHEHEVMENDVRFFVEECDALQGIQVLSDCATFGGFTDAFLTAFRDEYPKMPSLAFPLLSDASNVTVHAEEEQNAMKALNDALCIRSLETTSTISVPVQHPSSWQRGSWLDGLAIDLSSQYHTSALLATHIESATLPLRLKSSPYDIASLSSMLNASGTLNISHLSGMYPLPASVEWSRDAEKRIYDLSAVNDTRTNSKSPPIAEYARLQVSRGEEPCAFQASNLTNIRSTMYPTLTLRSIHAPPYPTPTSFPRFFASSSPPGTNAASQHDAKHRALSALSTSSATAPLFAAYAALAQECVDRRADVVGRVGLEFDEVRELKDDLWALCDRYAGPEGEWRAQEEVLSENED